MKKKKHPVWVAMATLKPLEDNTELGDADGAIVNVLDTAINEESFILKIQNQLNQFGYSLVELEDIELFDFTKEYDDNLNDVAKQVEKTGTLNWGTFYTFDEEE